MYSPEDRTAKAIIRDVAVALFGERGPDAVPLRLVAERSGVSQPLIIKHYGSRDGLVAAVDEHVIGLVRNAVHATALEESAQVRSIVEMLGDSAVTRYLSRLLTGDGPRSREAYAELSDFSRQLVMRLDEAGAIAAGVDHEQLAAVLLAHDLSLVLLRSRIGETLGADPLSGTGLRNWAGTVDLLYRGIALHVDHGRQDHPTDGVSSEAP
ncbi:AcrR family transcriptional regulator [Actinoalloteichus hoggarensis]|nr:TetR/AcrR family transcriptional regulator [Actinoalloteichus hoggarensis]MBB5921664.1 AcrR family transcriptional regulator [Actinoalloteichus hoggarensis]